MRYLLLLITQFAYYLVPAQQNVGIGTSSPTEKLHIAGNVKADTVKLNALMLTLNAAAGKVLTSDACGNANWVEINSTNLGSTGNAGFGVWGDCATNSVISEYNPVAQDDGANGDYFAWGLTISGNHAIVGARRDAASTSSGQGSVSFYRHNGSNWVLVQKTADASGTATDGFGSSVAIEGNTAVVGVPGKGVSGTVIIYKFNGSSWLKAQEITSPNVVANAGFGLAVAISGNTIVVGAENDQIGTKVSQGSASVFKYNGTSWLLTQKIVDATGITGAEFGKSVSVSGNNIIVGAWWETINAVIRKGSASIYNYNGTQWVLKNKLVDPNAGPLQSGISVSIDGNYAIVGASGDFLAGSGSGSASIYFFNGTNWILMQKILHSNPYDGDAFGCSVSISNNYVIVGVALRDAGANLNAGAACIYARVGMAWQKIQNFNDPVPDSEDNFGRWVAFDGATKRFVIGSFLASAGGKATFGKLN